jgi:hypothetical protein
MNRVQLVQVIVIIVAIVFGYEMISNLIVLAGTISSFFTSSGGMNETMAIYYGVIFIIYFVILFVIINNAKKITSFIIDKVGLDENVHIGFSDKSVLYAILLFLTLGTLLKNVPQILYNLFEIFSETAKGGRANETYEVKAHNFNWSRLIESMIALILLVNIKPVANYFHQKIDPHDPHFVSDEVESTSENK